MKNIIDKDHPDYNKYGDELLKELKVGMYLKACTTWLVLEIRKCDVLLQCGTQQFWRTKIDLNNILANAHKNRHLRVCF